MTSLGSFCDYSIVCDYIPFVVRARSIMYDKASDQRVIRIKIKIKINKNSHSKMHEETKITKCRCTKWKK